MRMWREKKEEYGGAYGMRDEMWRCVFERLVCVYLSRETGMYVCRVYECGGREGCWVRGQCYSRVPVGRTK